MFRSSLVHIIQNLYIKLIDNSEIEYHNTSLIKASYSNARYDNNGLIKTLKFILNDL